MYSIKELRRKCAREIISYLEGKGVNVDPFIPDFPQNLLLTFYVTMLIDNEKLNFMDDEDLVWLKKSIEKAHEAAQVEWRVNRACAEDGGSG